MLSTSVISLNPASYAPYWYAFCNGHPGSLGSCETPASVNEDRSEARETIWFARGSENGSDQTQTTPCGR